MDQANLYPPVNKHSNGKSPFSIGNTSSKGSFPIAMLEYHSKNSATQGPQLNRPKIRGESKAILQRRSGKDHPDSKGKHGVGRNGITEDIPGSAWKDSNDFTVAEKKYPPFVDHNTQLCHL